MFTYRYPHPAVTVDCVVFGLDDAPRPVPADADRRDAAAEPRRDPAVDTRDLTVLLIQRDLDPYAGAWALPGGFVQMDEELEAAALRELEEETGVRDLYVEQLGAFGTPGRDPRERVITIAYLAIVNLFDHPVTAATDARNAGWFALDELPRLAFDHEQILEAALERLRTNVRKEPVVFEFLPEKFTLRQVQSLYEAILGEPLDKRNFRKKLQATGLIVPLDEVEMDVAHRAAQLHRFDRERYEALHADGYRWNA
ncbi:MAG: NUDIX domain-containing protein [Spirochaetaceae bacterium]|nr:MAG: NUDIX domain-containing protein [Spirochaetaceae bacterium]